MRIRIGSNACIWIICIVLVYLNFLYLVRLPIDSVMYSYAVWMLSLAAYIYFYKCIRKIRVQNGAFLSKYFCYILFVQIIQFVYSTKTYNETMFDMLICAGSYLILLLTYVIMLSFEKDGVDLLINRICKIELIFIIIILIHSFFFNHFGISLFALITEASGNTLRYNRFRFGLGPLCPIFFIFSFKKFLSNENRLLNLIAIIIGFTGLFYSNMTRGSQIATVAAFLFMWLFNKERGIKTIVKYMIFIIGVVCFLNSNLYLWLLNIFSTNESLNSQAVSTLARYNAIEYFSYYTRENPLLGMGWVRPYTPRLTRIWSGPEGVAFLDDIGFLGHFFRLGILGASYYIILLIRMIYVIIRTDKQEKYRTMLIGIMTYIIFTMPSLNCFDGQRMLAMPFYLAIFEYTYYSNQRGNKHTIRTKSLI